MELQKNVYPGVAQSFGILGMSLLFGLAVGFPVGVIGMLLDVGHLKTPMVESAMNLVMYVGSFYLTFRWARKNVAFYKGEPAKMALGGVAPLVLGVSAMMVIATGFLLDPLTELIPRVEFFDELMLRTIRPDIFSFLTAVVAAPILEELLFRGIILDGMLKRYSPAKAILLSSMLFGLVHINPVQVVNAFFLGLLLGWMYWKTGSLRPSMLMHAANNGLAFVFLLLFPNVNESIFSALGGNIVIYGGIVLASGVIVWLGARYISKKEVVR